MLWLRQSTASQEIPLGYFVDSTDGNTEETGLTIANTDIKIWKTGATTLANKNSGGGTHISNGVYYCVLDATDTDTIGPLVVFIHVSGALAVRVPCVVLDEAVYDALFGTSALTTGGAITVSGGVVSANAVQLSGDSAAADNAEAFFDGTGYAGTNNVIPVVTMVNGLANNVITSSAIADGAITDAKVANDLTVGSVTGAVGSVAGNVGGNVVGSVGSVAGNVSGTVAGVAGNVTGSVASVTGNVGGNVVGSVASVVGNVGGSVNSVVTGVTLAASAIQAIWDALTSALSTAGSIGKLLVDNINATISSRSSHSASDAATAVWANGTRTLSAFSFSVTVGTNNDKTGYSLATDGISAASLSTAAAEKQADITLRRRMSNVEASSFGDALHLSSFYGFVQMGQEASVSGGTMTVKQTDGSTTLGTKTVTSTAGADPITAIT